MFLCCIKWRDSSFLEPFVTRSIRKRVWDWLKKKGKGKEIGLPAEEHLTENRQTFGAAVGGLEAKRLERSVTVTVAAKEKTLVAIGCRVGNGQRYSYRDFRKKPPHSLVNPVEVGFSLSPVSMPISDWGFLCSLFFFLIIFFSLGRKGHCPIKKLLFVINFESYSKRLIVC